MVRTCLLIIASVWLLGCQAPQPNFDPFALGGATRVPPPPTGAIGSVNGAPDLTPLPPANAGAAWPNNGGPAAGTNNGFAPTYNSGNVYPGNALASNSGYNANGYDQNGYGNPTAASQPFPNTYQQSQNPSRLGTSDQLAWRDPAVSSVPSYSTASNATYTSNFDPIDRPTNHSVWTNDSAYDERVGSPPPRVRGFAHAGVQPLRIPDELAAEFPENGIRQAAAQAGQAWSNGPLR